MPENQRSPSSTAIDALERGTIEIVGRVPWSSNFTFLTTVTVGKSVSHAIYKPLQGEQQLWDFPDGLYKREYGAYLLSAFLGWPNIPETVVRQDAEFGVGTLQRFIPNDAEQHYFTLFENHQHHYALQAIALFDLVANNTDRKAGHCLAADNGEIYAIDNALCFHVEPKLRTVIWDFAGEGVAAELIAGLVRLHDETPDELLTWIDATEIEALRKRIAMIVEDPVFPHPESPRQYPWPLI